MVVKTITHSLLAGLLFIVGTAIWAANIYSPPDKKAAVYTEDKQSILITNDHPVFTLQLKSNPTTGFSWFLREYNSSLITPIKHHFLLSEQKLMGAPGYELWTFQVKPAGFIVPQQTTIRMVYARPWQSENSTQIVFRIVTQRVRK